MKTKFILKKTIGYIFIILTIITINFFLVRFMPGDPVMHIIGEDEYYILLSKDPEVLEEIKGDYGLDKTIIEQYKTYIIKTIKLDFGNSYRTKTLVMETILYRMKWTLYLIVPAIIISALWGGIFGLKAGRNPGGKFDLIVTPLFLTLSTIPINCLSIIILLIFSFKLGIFPIGGITSGGFEGLRKTIDIIWHMILPLSVIVIYKTSSNYILMKSIVSQIRDEEYIVTAVSKGISKSKVLWRHIAINAFCPYITSICMQFGSVLAGSMMVEIVFSWKGMGTLIYSSVNAKDFPMIQTCFLFMGVCVVVFNLIADVIYMAVDPRVREGFVNE